MLGGFAISWPRGMYLAFGASVVAGAIALSLDRMNAIDDCAGQARAVDGFFRAHAERHERLHYTVHTLH